MTKRARKRSLSPRERELAARRRRASAKARAPAAKPASTKRASRIPFHPLADAFPLIEGDEFRELVADVKREGVRNKGALYQGSILDGRNRYRASIEAGVPMRFDQYKGNDPVGFVVSCNLRRRHMTSGQRAFVAAKLETFRHGGKRRGDASGASVSRVEAARLLNVSPRSVTSAAVVRDQGGKRLQDAVASGAVEPATAAAIATLPKAEQDKIAQLTQAEILKRAKAIRAEKTERRRADRVDKIAEQAKGNKPLGKGPWAVWLIDFPWRYEFPKMGDTDRSIENHYATWPLTKILKFCEQIKRRSTKHAIYYIWVLPCLRPYVEHALYKALGVKFSSEIVWDKVKPITGKRVRGRHETILIATRGKMPLPPPAAVPESLFACPRSGVHSEKPHDVLRPMIAKMYPTLPRVELFARGEVPNDWDAWGNEVAK